MQKDIQSYIQNLLEKNVAEGKEKAIQVAVYHKGRLVVNAYTSAPMGAETNPDTLFPVFSTTKGITATVLHIVLEKNGISVDEPICRYWKDFGTNGKENATIRHALNHTLGLANMPESLTLKDLQDWDKVCAAIAGEAPTTPVGTQREYHAVTFGFIVGEIASRIDGRSFQRLLEEEIKAPLNISDMYVGTPDKHFSRIAVLEEPNVNISGMLKNGGKGPQPIPLMILPLHKWMNSPDGRRCCAPASSGVMSALSLAKHYAALLPGGVEGVQLLSDEYLQNCVKPLIIEGFPTNMGLGYNLISRNDTLPQPPYIFGTGGYGGSTGFADLKTGIAVGITNSFYSEKSTVFALTNEIRSLFE